ncbi:MAG: OsmC family protein [Lactobacillus sp.]|nr:OsmC family protein [Lactobacillus sp.]MCI2033739.1 OsmC family protein [Lactobacillus sp.]
MPLTPGTSFIDVPEDLQLGVSSPLTPAPGTNPEQLLGLALPTCLKATLRLIEQRQHAPLDSVVRGRVDMGDQFTLTAQVRLTQHTPETAVVLLAQAQRECPVAKLVQANANVKVRLVTVFSDDSAF